MSECKIAMVLYIRTRRDFAGELKAVVPGATGDCVGLRSNSPVPVLSAMILVRLEKEIRSVEIGLVHVVENEAVAAVGNDQVIARDGEVRLDIGEAVHASPV
jgi:hypothetical protein